MSLQSTLKGALFAASQALGVQAVLRRMHRHRLLVLCYHGVVSGDHRGDRHEYRNTVWSSEFDRQIGELRRRFAPVAPADVVAWVQNGRPLPERAVLVTFDDGYRNNLTLAAPILERHGVPALVSVTTGHVGQRELLWPTEVELRIVRGRGTHVPSPDGDAPVRLPAARDARRALADAVRRQLKAVADGARRDYLAALRASTELHDSEIDAELVAFLDWDEVRALTRHGIAIGSHTVSHPILTRLEPDQLARELADSRARIERETGAACDCFVYPNGGPEDVSPQVTAAVARAGYAVAFTLMNGLNAVAPHDRHALDRVDVPGHVAPRVFGARTSGLYSRLIGRVGA